MGPTASGKSILGIELAKKFSGEIISVDSALIYRDMNIGTAKPTIALQKKIPHHLIDVCSPSETFSAAQFCRKAIQIIDDIEKNNHLPILVGGTMLYFRALYKGLSPLPSADNAVREQIEKEAREKGWDFLHEKLKSLDPEAALRIHPNDPQRLQRALEVIFLSGKSLTELQEENSAGIEESHSILSIAIAPKDRKILHERIEKRFDDMLAEGFLQEVRELFARGDLSPSLPSIRAVGYRQAWAFLSGEIDEKTFREKAIVATRQLAKRQLTWLRSWPNLHWFDSEDPELFEKVCGLVGEFLGEGY